MPLCQSLSDRWSHIQGFLFPYLRQEVGPLTEAHERIIVVLDVAPVSAFVQDWPGFPGRPLLDRHALARAFVAKAVLGIAQTKMLLDRLKSDNALRRLCGWERIAAIPSESTFSRAFAEFASSQLPVHVHEALVKKIYDGRIVGHISRDSTAIEAREKPVRSGPQPVRAPTRKRGLPRKGEIVVPKEPRRLEKQVGMSLSRMLQDLPTACTIGCKRNAKGHTTSWTGYKLHLDVADGGIPISCILTSASLHDSQAALPLAALTATRVRHLYDVMDSAYDAPEIRADSVARGHVALIDKNPRRGGKAALVAEARAKSIANYQLAEDVRYNERSTVERTNGAAKDTMAHGTSGCAATPRSSAA